MRIFSNQSPKKHPFQQMAERDAKEDYAMFKDEIKAFLRGLSASDKDFFNRSIEELVDLTLPYEGAVSYPNALAGEVGRIGTAISDRLGTRGCNYALFLYALQAPQFAGQVKGIWFHGSR